MYDRNQKFSHKIVFQSHCTLQNYIIGFGELNVVFLVVGLLIVGLDVNVGLQEL